MRIKDIKNVKDILNYFNVKSVKKVLTEIKNTKLSTTTKKALSYKLYKENSNKKILGKKSKEAYESYKAKSKAEKQLIAKYKEKYNVKNKTTVKKINHLDIRKNRVKSTYVTIKEKDKPSYQILKDDFKRSERTMSSGVHDNYIIAKAREKTKFSYITIPMTDKELKRMTIQDKFTNYQYLGNIAAEQKQKYMNSTKKIDIEIMHVSEIIKRKKV